MRDSMLHLRHRSLLLLALAACTPKPVIQTASVIQTAPVTTTTIVTTPPATPVEHAQWTRNAVLYEINVRQYTPEGTFAALQRHLPRLYSLGVDLLWIMPVQPIGVKNRKGGLGS